MAEILSQNQIDDLLNAALNGTMDLKTPADGKPEIKYRNYDFYSPRKFTKDRVKMLNSIFENYTRIINTRLNSLLHTSCEIHVESIEEQRYYEFSNALIEGDVLTIASLKVRDKVEDMPTLLHLTTPLSLSMMDRLMGGEGDVDDDLPIEYSFTDLELQLYDNIVKDLLSVMGNSWENYLPVQFIYERVEVNPTLVQLMGLDETVVIVDIQMSFSNCNGRISICLPGMMLTNIFAAIDHDNPSKRLSGEDNSTEIFQKLRKSDLEVVAEMKSAHLLLSDIYHLRVGDVVNLGQSKDSPVFLRIGEQPWFSGRMGIHNKNMAIRIGETLYKAEERSEQQDES